MLNIDSWIRFALTEIFAVLLMAFVFRKPLKEEKTNIWLKILLTMLAMYLAHMFYIFLSPTYFFRRFSFSTERLNLVPFRALKQWLAQPVNFFGSVLFFMPIGFFEVLLYPGRSRKWQVLLSATTAAVLSVFIEFAQLFNYRVPDVDDVILNTIGATLGALLCILLQRTGFDRTRVGRVLLPAIPASWNRHNLLNRFCIILVVTIEVVLFTANYIVTIPKPTARENTALQAETALPGEAAVPTETALPAETAEPEAAGTGVLTEPAPAEATPGTENTAVPAETAVPEAELTNPIPETAAPGTATQQGGMEVTETTDWQNAGPEAETDAEKGTEAPVQTQAPKTYHTENVMLEARNVLLVRLADENGGEQTIYAVDSTAPIYPASTLKMLTALTVLEIAEAEEKVTVGTEIYIPPWDASKAGLEYGMTLSVRELLEGLLLPSGADAAYALGVYCGRKLEGNDQLSFSDAVHSFVGAMNRKAAEIGAEHTTAVNVVGLDDGNQLATAEDILTLAKTFLNNPVLSEICHLPTATITSAEGKSVYLKNTNKMLFDSSEYYNENVAGVKTGTTSRAGNCLVSVFTVGSERFICIVMNSSYYGKFTDTQALYDMVCNAQ